MLSQSPVIASLPATDIARAKEFYSQKLGLAESSMQVPPDSVLYECGGGTSLYLYQRPPSHAEHTQAFFMVSDIESEMSELRGKGVVFEDYDMPGLKTENGVADLGGMKSAWFKDSEGNILGLGQKA